MFLTDALLVFAFCLFLFSPVIRSVQLRLVNGDNQDDYPHIVQDSSNQQKPDGYSYNYGVSDQNTGDIKTKWEKRENNVVRGAYSIIDADGTTRLVEYTADANGFRPVITKLDASSNVASNSPPAYPYAYNQRIPPTRSDNYDYNFRANTNYPNNPYGSQPGLKDVYNNGYYNKPRPTGRGFYADDATISGAPHHLSLRPERQPVPLLYSTYHGYDNLYH